MYGMSFPEVGGTFLSAPYTSTLGELGSESSEIGNDTPFTRYLSFTLILLDGLPHHVVSCS